MSLSALKALIIHMGGLKEGRKALILVSEGYTQHAAAAAARSDRGDARLGQSRAQAIPMPGRDSASLEDRAAFLAGIETRRPICATSDDLANRNNVAIYAVDPRGLATGEFGIDQNVSSSTDQQLSATRRWTRCGRWRETDGRAIVNRNDLTVGMKQIVRDTSAYYLLGYNSTSPRPTASSTRSR